MSRPSFVQLQKVQKGESKEDKTLKRIQILLSQRGDINTKNTDDETLLMVAVKLNHVKIVEYLIAQGADVNISGKGGFTPLMLAARVGNSKLAHLLASSGANVHAQTQFGQTVISLIPAVHSKGTIPAITLGERMYIYKRCQEVRRHLGFPSSASDASASSALGLGLPFDVISIIFQYMQADDHHGAPPHGGAGTS